jgi:hypothetical protein
VHPLPQLTGAFPVNDPYTENAFPAAQGKVVREQLSQLGGVESVEIEDAVNGEFHCVTAKFVVHDHYDYILTDMLENSNLRLMGP